MHNKKPSHQKEIRYIGIQVLDDFLGDPDIIHSLDSGKSELRPDRELGAPIWTFDKIGTEPLPPVKLLIEHVIRSACDSSLVNAVEYWCNVMEPGDHVPTHQDKDETLYHTTGIVMTPIFSAVYYPNVSSVIGGELELQGVTVLPRSNRIVIFDGHLLHRVHRVTSGTRSSIVINGWTDAPIVWICGKKGRYNNGR